MITEELKAGSILSETSFYKVQKIKEDHIVVLDDMGNEIRLGKLYVDKVLSSADYFESEEKINKTAMAELFINSPRIAMTVAFFKKDKEKTKKAYETEVKEAIDKVQNAKVSEVEGLLKNLIENPISKVIPGELRVMKGRHYGNIDELGRVHFIDMEIEKESGKDYDSRMRQVDPRTIMYLIINNIKYSLK